MASNWQQGKDNEENMSSLKCHRPDVICLQSHSHRPELNHMALSQLQGRVLMCVGPNFLCHKDHHHQEMNDSTRRHSNAPTEVERDWNVLDFSWHWTSRKKKKITGWHNPDYLGQIRLLLYSKKYSARYSKDPLRITFTISRGRIKVNITED